MSRNLTSLRFKCLFLINIQSQNNQVKHHLFLSRQQVKSKEIQQGKKEKLTKYEELIFTWTMLLHQQVKTKNYFICCFDSRKRIIFFANADTLQFFKWVGRSCQISVAIKEIDCLPKLICHKKYKDTLNYNTFVLVV